MSEPILRAWDNKNKKWLECFVISKYNVVLVNESMLTTALIEYDAVLCRSTGLKDKNGNLIFENDLISLIPVSENGIMKVCWHDIYASFVLRKQGWVYSHYFGESVDNNNCEIIGNIFDTPHLLEDKQ